MDRATKRRRRRRGRRDARGNIFAKGYGLADVKAKTPFTADSTLVRPGSISKLFTAIAVMQLVEAGKLDLDRDVNDYLDFAIPTPEGGVPVTLRLLLRHRAGFEEHAKGLFSRGAEPEPLGAWLKRSLPRRIYPNGDVAAYSNYGFALAGYIVERAAHEPFADYAARHILLPLGMTRSTFAQPTPTTLAATMAKGYRAADRPLGFFETIAASPAGALSTTGADMARFLRALLKGGELDGARILSKARLDEMMSPQGDETSAGYIGLAFHGQGRGGYERIGHAGGTMAFASDLALFPEGRFGIFLSIDGAEGAKDLVRLADMRTLPAKNGRGGRDGDSPLGRSGACGRLAIEPARRVELRDDRQPRLAVHHPRGWERAGLCIPGHLALRRERPTEAHMQISIRGQKGYDFPLLAPGAPETGSWLIL